MFESHQITVTMVVCRAFTVDIPNTSPEIQSSMVGGTASHTHYHTHLNVLLKYLDSRNYVI